ncbi:PQQ-binding-like beta-propeller repeat protein [Schlesneria paludicola]|uniref:PQQ-binding-like beta-propeller repeat protein n=1 Tax=Schlesneria paludicola TaxID=360056 RepID=UPI00029A365A|nr:PQQ-binding-like beta-propeller repeat protein [Schlesneria paludicola]
MSDTTIQVDSKTSGDSPTRRLRLWPGVLVIVALWSLRIWASVGEPAPSKFFFGLIVAPAAAMLLLALWWLLASRLRWSDRLVGIAVLALTGVGTSLIAGKNFPVMGLILYAIPVVATLWVTWLLVSWKLSWPVRRAGMLLVFLGCGAVYSMLRVDGMDGSFAAAFNWRWTPTPESKLLSELKSTSKPAGSSTTSAVVDLVLKEGDWPSFRGPRRDGSLTGVRIRTDWDKTPPKELWRHRIGPGWSSFSVIGHHLFTQEQRGDDEFVVCYDTESGNEIWAHRDKARFEEVVAGAGPRGTPTFHEGRILALGATGRLNCLNAATGEKLWSADIVADTKAKTPQWGFSGSPLVSHGLVTVFAGGPEGKGVAAYKFDSGELAWTSGDGSHSYCSTHPATMGGVEQVLVTSDVGLASYEPESGKVLWEHRWPVEQARVVQPAILNDTDVLLGTGMTGGTRRLSVHREGEEWKLEEQWTSKVIKPYYNDFVVRNDYLYGFDNNIFMCVGLADGKMKWRTRGYGNGQVLLLADDALLLILTEQGEVALVEARPEEHKELVRIKAIEGKTWNHPVVAHGKLFVRNAEEIAGLELPLLNTSLSGESGRSEKETATSTEEAK